MTTALITLICISLSLAIFAGAFYLAKYVIATQHRVHVLEDTYREATEHIQEQEKNIILLQQEIDLLRRSAEIHEHRERPRTWNPSDPFNTGERYRE